MSTHHPNAVDHRSSPAWRVIGAVALVLLLIALWLMGRGPNMAGCCAAATAVPAPMPAPVLTPSTALGSPPAPVVTPPALVSLEAALTPLSGASTLPKCAGKVTLNASFATGSARLTPDGNAALKTAAACITGPTEIGGHTDSTGDAVRNQSLSQARADAVKAALLANGVKPEWLTAKGYGSAKPLGDNATSEGRAKNRRIELGS